MSITIYHSTRLNGRDGSGRDAIKPTIYIYTFRKDATPYCVSWKVLKVAANWFFSHRILVTTGTRSMSENSSIQCRYENSFDEHLYTRLSLVEWRQRHWLFGVIARPIPVKQNDGSKNIQLDGMCAGVLVIVMQIILLTAFKNLYWCRSVLWCATCKLVPEK
jgi:hypothetical protein